MTWHHTPGGARTPRVSVPKVAVPKAPIVKQGTTGGKTGVYNERNRPRAAKTVSKPKGVHH